MKSKSISYALLLLMVLAAQLSLTGCNTLSGAGEDIQSAGETIEDTAEETADEF
jgi:predicted small secreted protein